VAVVCSILVAPPVAEAQVQAPADPLPSLSLQRFRPAPGGADYLSVFGASVDLEKDQDMNLTGGFYFNFGNAPLRLSVNGSGDESNVVDYQFGADLFTSFAFYRYFEVGLVVPILLAQQRDTTITNALFADQTSTAGLGDMRLTAKAMAPGLEGTQFKAALVMALSVPTGGTSNFYGDGGVGGDIIAVGDWSPLEKWRISLNTGFRFRPGNESVGDFDIGSSVTLGGGISFPLAFISEDLDFLGEINGEIVVNAGSGITSEERPVEALFGGRYRLWDKPGIFKDLSLTAAIGLAPTAIGAASPRVIFGLGYFWVNGGKWRQDFKGGGYIGDIEECPDPSEVPLSKMSRFCRELALSNKEPDSDGDGVPDSKDKCPDTPEDKNGFEDLDGCPEGDRDTDEDTILDRVDACPTEQEVFNGIDDEDGCPDEDPNASAVIRDGKVEIREQVFFETSRAKIKTESYGILNDVADLLVANPQIKFVEIEGHTDDRGSDRVNLELSQARAEAVREYLIGNGVEEERLEAKGYGETRPIADNETSEGRAQNRRVEFTIRATPSAGGK